MKHWLVVALLGLASCLAFAADAGKKPVLLSESLKKEVESAKQPIDDLNKKQEELRKEFTDLQKRAQALQDEFNKIEQGRPVLQRKYDAAIESAFKAVGLDKEEDLWDFDVAKGQLVPKSTPSQPAPTNAGQPGATK